MKLSEFVSETIKEIIAGVTTAQAYGVENNAAVNPLAPAYTMKPGDIREPNFGRLAQWIEFDVAVTTSEGDKAKGGFGIFVGPIGAGTQGQTESLNSTSNRIKFSIPVMLPYVQPYPSSNKTS